MLTNLYVKNLALIEEVDVDFEPGLNILTGETGAGKSIIIGSIGLALGAKADLGMIRQGADSGLIRLAFSVSESDRKRLSELLEEDIDDDTVVISRKLSQGKSTAKVNGLTVSARQLKEIAGILFDLYGQREHQDLISKKNHLDLLDDYAGEPLFSLKKEIAEAYTAYRSASKAYTEENKDESVQNKEIELAEFEYREIEEASLKPGEDEELERIFHKMENVQKIAESVSRALAALSSDDDGCALSLIGAATREVKAAQSFDEALASHVENLLSAEDLLHDAARGLSDYLDAAEFDEALYNETKERLNLVNKLKSKYGDSIEAVLAYMDELADKLERWKDHDAYVLRLEKELEKRKAALTALCRKAHEIRTDAAKHFEAVMKETLLSLSFLDASFEVRITSGEDLFSQSGYDDAEFWISANPGELLRPLQNVASGGELSRIMLAFKTVMAGKEDLDTMIFDEIDAGISGIAAWQVSEKLGALSKAHQIICITHLAQIAAMADAHYGIVKEASDGRTHTKITRLSEEEGIWELARLLGSGSLSDAAIENAKEMRRNAKERV
ncbi:MAG: DNA repair protein RecN [Lachnospiraceae bacterium]|nr:DNA repair protein RecN [Lachnospiraceae bacterium]